MLPIRSPEISTVNWESDVYAKGLQKNLWPFSEVVSVFSRERRQNSANPTLLEIGSGTGNNLWFLGESGFKISGIEYSQTAVDFSTNRLTTLGIQADIRQGTIYLLPWRDETFDYVLDRAVLAHSTYSEISLALSEIERVLRPNGKIFSFTLFGLNHPDRKHGEEVETGTYDYFNEGVFATSGRSTFFDESIIKKLFCNFKDLEIRRQVEFKDDLLMSEYFTVSGTKKDLA